MVMCSRAKAFSLIHGTVKTRFDSSVLRLMRFTLITTVALLLSHFSLADEERSSVWHETQLSTLKPELRPIAQEQDAFCKPGNALDQRALENRLLACIVNTRSGLESAISVLETTSDPDLRLAVAYWLAESATNLSYFDPGTDPRIDMGIRFPVDGHELAGRASRAIELAVKKAESTEEFVEFSRHFSKLQDRRMYGLTYSKLQQEVQQDEPNKADALRLLMQHQFYLGTLPQFMYNEFPRVHVPDTNETPIRVLAFGDFGNGRPEQFETANAMEREHTSNPFHLGITLGDNFLPDGLDNPLDDRWQTQWEDLYGSLGITFYPALGNHDYHRRGSVLASLNYSNYSDSWVMPAPSYRFRVGDAEFFALDTNVVTHNQLTWLKDGLTSSDANWKIVYAHHPIYSSVYTGDTEPNNLVDRLLPVLLDAEADAYISGHAHLMEEWEPQGDLHLFVTGPAGSQARSRSPKDGSIFSAAEYGYLTLDITSSALVVRFVNQHNEVVHTRKIANRGDHL